MINIWLLWQHNCAYLYHIMSPCVASMFKKNKLPTFNFICLCCDLDFNWSVFVLRPPEKLIVCITQTGPSLPYHCYWGEKIQMHRLSPSRLPPPPFPFLSSLSFYHHTDGIRRWGLASKESGRVAGETFHATRVPILKHLLFTNSFKCSNKNIYSVF